MIHTVSKSVRELKDKINAVSVLGLRIDEYSLIGRFSGKFSYGTSKQFYGDIITITEIKTKTITTAELGVIQFSEDAEISFTAV